MRTLALTRLWVRDVRNFERLDLEPGRRFNVIHGDNGQGKTNLIEAIYVAATSRSFRTSRSSEIIRRGAAAGSVRASFEEGDIGREQTVGLEGGRRVLRVDGERPRSSAEYAGRTPVVAFSPSSLDLTMGSGAGRRALLDRVALYSTPDIWGDLVAYGKAVRSRQRVLETRGVGARDLDEWEELMVRHGCKVVQLRSLAAEALLAEAHVAWPRIGAPGLAFEGRYTATAPVEAEAYRSALAEARARDSRRRSASIGPHRDDLLLEIAGMPARTTASQGQHRMLVLALKAAEVAVVGKARQVEPLLLLDDVSSELDAARTAAFFDYLGAQRGQVFVTTTRPELITVNGASETTVSFRIVEGRIQR